ncbi:hypothetical protein G3I31_00965 [Streptomyces sp. SID9913]|uniref:glycosyltransferase n=1 Tax=Streptomyces sp. SID9913 TaxID=2706117 RepID=UPI0013DC3461|nr:glycosyltransferase [Streptomyces sp. SID9913]NED16762.1 hypothetical protein [Streptomyces sp. SID9913]
MPHFDDSLIRELGRQWIENGQRLHDYVTVMDSSMTSMNDGWTGKAGEAAQVVWSGVADHNVRHALLEAGQVAQDVGNAIIAYADELQKTVEEINRAHVIEALATIFGLVLGLASFGIAGLLGRLLSAVADIVAGIVSRISSIASAAAGAGRAAAFVTDATINAALTLGTDIVSNLMASRAVNAPLHIDWQSEGMNVGLGVWMGAGMGGLETAPQPSTTGRGVPQVAPPSATPKPIEVTVSTTVERWIDPLPVPVSQGPSTVNLSVSGARGWEPRTNHAPPADVGMQSPAVSPPRLSTGRDNAVAPRPENMVTVEGSRSQASAGHPVPAVRENPAVETSGGQFAGGRTGQSPPAREGGSATPVPRASDTFLDAPPQSAKERVQTPIAPRDAVTGDGRGAVMGRSGANEAPPLSSPTPRLEGVDEVVASSTGTSRGALPHGGTSVGGPLAHPSGPTPHNSPQAVTERGGAADSGAVRPAATRGPDHVREAGTETGTANRGGSGPKSLAGPHDFSGGPLASDGPVGRSQTSAEPETSGVRLQADRPVEFSAGHQQPDRHRDIGSLATAHAGSRPTDGADQFRPHQGSSDWLVHSGGRHTADDARLTASRDGDASDASGPHRREFSGPDSDGSTKAFGEWTDFIHAQARRYEKVIEMEDRLEALGARLDDAWRKGFERHVAGNELGVAGLRFDSHEVSYARWTWRKDITQAFRNEVETKGFVSAFDSIVQGAERNAHKYLERSHQVEVLASNFKAEISAFRSGGTELEYRRALPDFDSIPRDYIYDSNLNTFVRDDSKLYGIPAAEEEGPIKIPGGPDGDEIEVFFTSEGRGEGPVDYFRDKTLDFNPLETFFIQKVEKLNDIFSSYLNDQNVTALPSDTRRQLDGLRNGLYDDLEAITVREFRIEAMTEEKFKDIIAWQSAGNGGRDALGAEFVTRIRGEFQRDLRAVHDRIFGDNPAKDAHEQWDLATDRAIADLPGRITRERFIQSKLSEETAHAEGYLSRLGKDALAGLGETGRERVLGEYLDTVREHARNHYTAMMDKGRIVLADIEAGWAGQQGDVRAAFPRTVRHEVELQDMVVDAAHDFNEILRPADSVEAFQLNKATISRLADDFRTERVQKYDELFATAGHKTETWLAHESAFGDRFHSRLGELREDHIDFPTRRGRVVSSTTDHDSLPAAGENPPARNEPADIGTDTDQDVPAPQPQEGNGAPRPASVEGGEPQRGRTSSDAESPTPSRAQQLQVTANGDTARSSGAPGFGRGHTAVARSQEQISVVLPTRRDQMRSEPRAANAPGVVRDRLSSDSEYSFSSEELDHISQEIQDRRSSGYTHPALDPQTAGLGRALHDGASSINAGTALGDRTMSAPMAPARKGDDPDEVVEDVRVAAGLLDEQGSPRTDLLDNPADYVEVTHVTVTRTTGQVRRELSREDVGFDDVPTQMAVSTQAEPVAHGPVPHAVPAQKPGAGGDDVLGTSVRQPFEERPPRVVSEREGRAGSGAGNVLAVDDDLFHTVNLRLRRLGLPYVDREAVREAYEEVVSFHGGVVSDRSTPTFAEKVTAFVLDALPGRVPGGAQQTVVAGGSVDEQGIVHPPAVASILPSPSDFVGRELARADRALTRQEYDAVLSVLDEHLSSARHSSVRILMQRVHERAERSLGSAWQEDAERLRDQVEAWMNHSISLGGVFGDMRKVPRTINFMWIGDPITSDALRNLEVWARMARESGYRVQIWTDTTPGPSGSAVSTWSDEAKRVLKELEVARREITSLLPLKNPYPQRRTGWFMGRRPVQAGQSLDDPNLVKLRDLYERARTNRESFPLASDVVRYALLSQEGGIYADIDIAPGAVDLSRPLAAMGRDDIPVLGPMLRDSGQLRSVQEQLAAERNTTPDRITVTDAVRHRLQNASYGNHFFVTPPGATFMQRLIDVVPFSDDLADDDFFGTGSVMTGLSALARALDAHVSGYGLGDISATELAAGIDPAEADRWIHLDWVTSESDHQDYEARPFRTSSTGRSASSVTPMTSVTSTPSASDEAWTGTKTARTEEHARLDDEKFAEQRDSSLTAQPVKSGSGSRPDSDARVAAVEETHPQDPAHEREQAPVARAFLDTPRSQTLPPHPVSTTSPTTAVRTLPWQRSDEPVAFLHAAVDAAVQQAAAQAGTTRDAFTADPGVLNGVSLMEAVLAQMYPVAGTHNTARPGPHVIRPSTTVDDLAAGSLRAEDRLVPGGTWTPVPTVDQIVRALHEAGRGSTVLLLEEGQGSEDIGHALLYAHIGTHPDGRTHIVRVDPQEPRPVETLHDQAQEQIPAGRGTRVIVIAPTGRAVDLTSLSARTESATPGQALADKGKGRAPDNDVPAMVGIPTDSEGRPLSDFTAALTDASEVAAALTDARRSRGNALSNLVNAQRLKLNSSLHIAGAGVTRARNALVRADAELALVEKRWNEVSGGAPLPEVREVEPRYGLSPGGASPSRWTARISGHDATPAALGPVQSVTFLPAATHVVTPLEGGGVSHALVPSGQDLTVAQWLSEPQSARGWPEGNGKKAYEGDLQAHQDVLSQALAGADHENALKSALVQQQKSFQENVELFRALEGRAELRKLRMPQLAAIVMAERRALRTLSADADFLAAKLQSGDWEWAQDYPLEGERADDLIAKVHKHLQENLTLTVNRAIGDTLQGGGTLLDAMTGSQQLLRNAWETDAAGAGYFARRGTAEETLGLPASVKRTTEASGIYPSAAGASFAPTAGDRADLPNYAALTSRYQPGGVTRYGQAAFHLHADVMQRATFTPADSLNDDLQGARSVTGRGNMLPLLNHGPEHLVRLAFAEATDFHYDSELRGRRDAGALELHLHRYFEAQIHGGVKWDDLDRVVLVDHGFDPATLQAQKLQLEQFARANGLSFTVETLSDFPGTQPAAVTAPAGEAVHEIAEDVRFAAGLLDEQGAPRTDLLGDPADDVKVTHVTMTRPPRLTHGELSRDDDIFYSVNLRLNALDWPLVDREEVARIHRDLLDESGGSLGRTNMRQLAVDIVARITGQSLPRVRGGAVGMEVEDRHVLESSLPLPANTLLARHTTGVQLVVDRDDFYRGANGALYESAEDALEATNQPSGAENLPIVEIVVPPLAVLDRDAGRLSEADGRLIRRSVRQALNQADRQGHPVPLRQLLSHIPGWTFETAGWYSHVHPSPAGADHPAYSQFTVGVAAGGLKHMIGVAEVRLAYEDFAPLMAAGRQFAGVVAAKYATQQLQREVKPSEVDFLTDFSGVDEVHGYVWLAFLHAAVAPLHDRFFAEEILLYKSMLPVALRNPFHVLRASLSQPVLNYLNAEANSISNEFETHLRRLVSVYAEKNFGPDGSDEIMFTDVAAGGGIALWDYLGYLLRGHTQAGETVTQDEVFGLDDYMELDTNNSRYLLPAALLELRDLGAAPVSNSPGSSSMTEDEIDATFQYLAGSARWANTLAERFLHGPRLLPGGVVRLLSHPLVQAVQGLFAALDELGGPVTPAPVLRAYLAAGIARNLAFETQLPAEVPREIAAIHGRLQRAAHSSMGSPQRSQTIWRASSLATQALQLMQPTNY